MLNIIILVGISNSHLQFVAKIIRLSRSSISAEKY